MTAAGALDGSARTQGAYFVIVPATTAMGALSGRLAGAEMLALGALAGAAWGLLVGWTAGLVRRRTTRFDTWALRSTATAGFVMAALFGGALFQMLLYVAASAPQSVLGLMQPPFKGGFTFFLLFNTLAEWLVIPLALFMNWHIARRRRLLVAGAVLYYGARVWTYVYFVPRIFEFMTLSTTAALTAANAARIMNWVQLSWIRLAIDGAVAMLFALAAIQRSHEEEQKVALS
jgi:hypothetical protein